MLLSVITSGWMPANATPSPFTSPTARPSASASSVPHSGSGCVATMHAARLTTEPTDKSMPAISATTIWPNVTISNAVICALMLAKFCGVEEIRHSHRQHRKQQQRQAQRVAGDARARGLHAAPRVNTRLVCIGQRQCQQAFLGGTVGVDIADDGPAAHHQYAVAQADQFRSVRSTQPAPRRRCRRTHAATRRSRPWRRRRRRAWAAPSAGCRRRLRASARS